MEAEAVVHQAEAPGRAQDEAEGLAALYRQEYGPMVRLAHLITGSNEAAEDIVQDAFVRMHRSWDRADRPGPYLRRIVLNGCNTWHRRRRLERERMPRPVTEGVEPEARELLDALARLSLRQRSALVLRFYADMTEAGVAEALGCRPGTVKSLVHRGLRELEGMIER